jgi:hypothetical protein
MSKKSAKFAAAIAVAIVACVAVTAGSRAASSADECLTEPNGPTSQGKHWFYHIERGSGRKCWYQRGQDDAAANTTAQDQSTADDNDSSAKDQVQSAKDQPPPSKPPARRSEAPATRSIADARAELPARAPASDDSAAPAPAIRTAQAAPPATANAASNSVFPDPSTVLGPKPAADTSPSVTDAQTDTTASITPEPAPAPSPVPQAAPPANRHLGSIPMLLLVAFGALGLAGLTGNAVWRLASASRRARGEDRWRRNVKPQPVAARRPRPAPARAEPLEEKFGQQHFVRDDVESLHPAEEPVDENVLALYAKPPRADAHQGDVNHRREEIEAHLAQLTRQLQADLAMAARAE